MEENKNKKFLVSTIIGVLSMVIVVVGATYAYFTVGVQNNFTETKVSTKIEDIGTVSLLPETNELTLDLSANDMLQQESDVIYYATKDGATTMLSSEVIAKASVTGAGIFNCTYDITMTATGENNMYEAVYGTNTAPAIELWVDGNRFIFNQANLFPQTISGEIVGLTADTSHEIVAQLALMNDASIIQDHLKGTDLEISFKITNFDCKNSAMGDNAKYIFATSPENLSTEIIDGLYRYQGTQEEVTNNYICWGTLDKDECLAEDSDYLFRIIGITPDGQLKIIQNKLTSTSYFDNYQLTSGHLAIWPNSNIGPKKLSLAWSEGLVAKNWRYGEITQEEFAGFTTVEQVLAAERKFNNVAKGKVGIISINDFFNHDTCFSGSTLNYGSICTDGWLFLNNIDDKYGSAVSEWGSVKLYGTQMAFTMNGIGHVSVAPVTSVLNIRKVAYVLPSFVLKLKQGTGTITDPYIFKV